MCGIVGVLGKNQVAPLLVEALKRLEYRGYDSAGIATVNDGAPVHAECSPTGGYYTCAEDVAVSPDSEGNIVMRTRATDVVDANDYEGNYVYAKHSLQLVNTQIAHELTQYVPLIVVTTEGGYTTKFLADGMNSVRRGLTGQIDAALYPEEFQKEDLLDSTIHTVATTVSDLRRVYHFDDDPDEMHKIFINKKS